MVYIAPDGSVHQNKPWGISRISDCFWNVLNFIYAFFRTLIPGGSGASSRINGTRGSFGGPGGPDGPGGPRRRMGGITTIQDCSMPGGG